MFQVTAQTSSGQLLYQWQRGGQNLSDGTSGDVRFSGSATRELTVVLLGEGEGEGEELAFRCVVTSTHGGLAVSDSAQLSVRKLASSLFVLTCFITIPHLY